MRTTLPFAANRRHTALPHLYCFPASGASASGYLPWTATLGDLVAVNPVQLPGRETRLCEPAAIDLRALADDLSQQLEVDHSAGYALFGHSLGGLVAFEVTRALRRHGRPLPRLLVVSATSAPHLSRTDVTPPEGGSDDAHCEYLRLLGGTSAEALASPELMALVIPILRADLAMYRAYTYVAEAPLSVPILAIGGTADPVVSPAQIRAWSAVAGSTFHAELLPGGHFYFNEQFFARLRRELGRH